jgi:hypothetical protein
LGQGMSGADGSLPPHPLSVSAVHPLLIHHSDSLQPPSASSSSNIATSLNTGIQITSMAGLNNTANSNIVSAISPILRNMRHNLQVQQQNQQSQQQQQTRPLRKSIIILETWLFLGIDWLFSMFFCSYSFLIQRFQPLRSLLRSFYRYLSIFNE